MIAEYTTSSAFDRRTMREAVRRFLDWSEVHPSCGGRSTPLFRVAVSLWIVFCVVACVKAIASPLKHNSYYPFYVGSSLWWHNLDIYDLSYNEFRYGPAFAVAFTPLTNLPMWLGSLVWMAFTLAVFCWSLRVLVRDILPGRWTANREAAFLLLVLALSYRSMWTAQTNTVILASVVAGLQAILQRRWGWAALWLAIPVHIKVWPLAVALLLIVCWPRQLAARFAGALVAIAAIPFFTRWPSIVVERYHDWLHALTGPMQVRHDYRDLWTLWEVVYKRVDPAAYALLQLSMALLVLALCLRVHRRGVPVAYQLTFTLGVWAAWQLTAGPGSERSTFSIMAPLAAWGVVASLANKRGRLLAVCAIVLMLAASIGQLERSLQGMLPLVRGAHPIGVIVFVGWLLRETRRWPVVVTVPETWPAIRHHPMSIRAADHLAIARRESLAERQVSGPQPFAG